MNLLKPLRMYRLESTTTYRAAVAAACAALTLNACTPAPIAVTNRIMDSLDRRMYLDYRRDAERINLEREKAGLPPNPILISEEWARANR